MEIVGVALFSNETHKCQFQCLSYSWKNEQGGKKERGKKDKSQIACYEKRQDIVT